MLREALARAFGWWILELEISYEVNRGEISFSLRSSSELGFGSWIVDLLLHLGDFDAKDRQCLRHTVLQWLCTRDSSVSSELIA